RILDDRAAADGGRPQPLPPEVAIAFVLELLPAISYLHQNGLVYCDLKPDNIICSDGSVRLVDLGAVRPLDDRSGPIYGTPAFQAPEVGDDGPSVASDVYGIGRTLLALCVDQEMLVRDGLPFLPDAGRVPVLARHPALHRLIARATADD